MFPLSKLERLPSKTALKKIALTFQNIEMQIYQGKVLAGDPGTVEYLAGLLAFLKKNPLSDKIPEIEEIISFTFTSPENTLRTINSLRNALLRALGARPAEWDLIDYEKGVLDKAARIVFPIQVFLEDIRSPFNVGSIFRTAEAFGVSKVFLSASTPLPDHPRASRTARGAERVVPYAVADLAVLGGTGPVFALETGGASIDEFQFPSSGTVLVGSEELGLSPEALRAANESKGCVSIPLAGAKRSLNVAVAFGILMQTWFSFLEASCRNAPDSRKET
jgi:TrmH family RNA methyltransferase